MSWQPDNRKIVHQNRVDNSALGIVSYTDGTKLNRKICQRDPENKIFQHKIIISYGFGLCSQQHLSVYQDFALHSGVDYVAVMIVW